MTTVESGTGRDVVREEPVEVEPVEIVILIHHTLPLMFLRAVRSLRKPLLLATGTGILASTAYSSLCVAL